MPQYCCVPCCKNKIGGHQFPKDPELRKKWRIAIRRKCPARKDALWEPNAHDVVCKAHFKPEDYTPYSKSRKRLFPGASPSMFEFHGNDGKVKPRSTRLYGKAGEPKINENKNHIILDDDVPDIQQEIEVVSERPESMNDIQTINSDEADCKASTPDEKTCEALISFEKIKNDPVRMKYFTGFSNCKHFELLFNVLGEACYNLRYRSKLGPKDELLITLMKLRQAKDDIELSLLFSVSESTISLIINTWINFLFYQLKELDIWPSKQLVQQYMPSDFKSKFPMTRVILDATETPIERPSNVLWQTSSFSTYKNRNTVKTLVGCSPRGQVTFISDSYGGSTSDRQIIERSTLLSDSSMFEKGDSIMADRGINVQDLFATRDVHVNIPNFLRGKSQLEPHEVSRERKIASKHIHVERLIGLAKRFKILKKDLPHSKLSLGNKITFVCFSLTNFLPCIVSDHA